jgi:hypothetical protein
MWLTRPSKANPPMAVNEYEAKEYLHKHSSKIKHHFVRDETRETVESVRNLVADFVKEHKKESTEEASADLIAVFLRSCKDIPLGKIVKYKAFYDSLEGQFVKFAITL